MSSVGTKLDANQVLKQAYDEAENRIRVDAVVSASIGQVQIIDGDGDELNVNTDGSIDVNVISPIAVEIDAADGDNIAINDGTNTMLVNADGSIDVNLVNPIDIEVNAADGDSVMIVGTEDGTPAGIQHTLHVDANLDLHVRDDDANVTLDALLLELSAKTEPSDAQNIRALSSVTDSVTAVIDGSSFPLDVEIDALNSPDPDRDNILIVGSDNGQQDGNLFAWVNNLRQNIMAAADRIEAVSWADLGTCQARITQIDYTSATIGAFTARKIPTYTQVGNRYYLSGSSWSLV